MTIKKNIKYDEGSGIPDEYGTKRWYQDNQLHRLDGPAIEYADGDKEWHINGLRHREDGPAVELADGYKHWCLNGKLHRIEGPAVELADGSKQWWLNNKHAIEIKDQTIEIGKKVIIDNDVGVVLGNIKGIFYEVLLGSKKILIVSLVK